jgi:hypothetical protein
MHTFILSVLGTIFSWVFKTSKETTQSAKEDIFKATIALSNIGGKRLREFLSAVPMLILFVRELVVKRKQFDAKSEMMILGAGVALGTLFTISIFSALSSISLQAMLLFTYPIVGIPLFFATQSVLVAIVVFLVWLIAFVLNTAFATSANFVEIRNRFLPESTQEMLESVQSEVAHSGADLQLLNEVVTQSLNQRGINADADALTKRLDRAAKKKIFPRPSFIADSAEKIENFSPEELLKRSMREESEKRREKALEGLEGRVG